MSLFVTPGPPVSGRSDPGNTPFSGAVPWSIGLQEDGGFGCYVVAVPQMLVSGIPAFELLRAGVVISAGVAALTGLPSYPLGFYFVDSEGTGLSVLTTDRVRLASNDSSMRTPSGGYLAGGVVQPTLLPPPVLQSANWYEHSDSLALAFNQNITNVSLSGREIVCSGFPTGTDRKRNASYEVAQESPNVVVPLDPEGSGGAVAPACDYDGAGDIVTALGVGPGAWTGFPVTTPPRPTIQSASWNGATSELTLTFDIALGECAIGAFDITAQALSEADDRWQSTSTFAVLGNRLVVLMALGAPDEAATANMTYSVANEAIWSGQERYCNNITNFPVSGGVE